MRTKAPKNRRKFTTVWDEINYLYDKLLYWFYDREDRRKSLPFAERLGKLLKRLEPTEKQAIFVHECRALIAELKGNLTDAVKHREKEIASIRKLHRLTVKTPHQEYAFRQYDFCDLSDRLDLLAMLYYDLGKIRRAIEVVQESKRLCEKNGIPFDGQDLLDEYLEANQLHSQNGKKTRAYHAKA